MNVRSEISINLITVSRGHFSSKIRKDATEDVIVTVKITVLIEGNRATS